MARKKVKDIKKLTDVVINNDEVIGKVTDIISREELEKSDKQITGAIQEVPVGLNEYPVKSMSTVPPIGVPESMEEALANKDLQCLKDHNLSIYNPSILTKNFTCVSVNLGSKGAKIANFYQDKEMGYNRNKPLTLFFDADEECKFESGKKYNFIISEV